MERERDLFPTASVHAGMWKDYYLALTLSLSHSFFLSSLLQHVGANSGDGDSGRGYGAVRDPARVSCVHPPPFLSSLYLLFSSAACWRK